MTETEIKIKVEVIISEQVLSDLLCCAFEGGIGFWAKVDDSTDLASHFHEEVLADGGWVTLSDNTGEGFPEDGPDRVKLDRETAIKGLGVMAATQPHHFAHVVDPSLMDSTTGSVFVQCACFGEVVFG